jgi:hypothetical protein
MNIDSWKTRTKRLKSEVHVLYLVSKDPRTPWYAKVLAAFIIGYALSRIRWEKNQRSFIKYNEPGRLASTNVVELFLPRSQEENV